MSQKKEVSGMNNPNDVIKTVMYDHHMTQADMARLFGISPQAVNNRFRSGSWNIDDVVKLLDAMDCKLVIESGSIKRYVF